MARIITYEEASNLNLDDYLLIDGTTDGTRKIKPSSVVQDLDSIKCFGYNSKEANHGKSYILR